MTEKTAVIFGGTGFLGRNVSNLLRETGYRVVVATRHGGKSDLVVEADVTDPQSVRSAVDGTDAVVNCVSLYREEPRRSFNDIHVLGARNVAGAASHAGVGRLVHISGIGADRCSSSPYISARGKGETAVLEAFPGAVVLRPSAMIGPENDLLSTIAGIPDWLPAIPLFGDGSVRLQPVHVYDVARAVRAVLDDDKASGIDPIFELGGPDIITYRELLRLVMDLRGNRRPLIPIPMFAWSLLANTAGAAGLAPVTEGTVALLRTDNVATHDLPGLADLDIHDPTSLKETARIRFNARSSAGHATGY